jgi:hypothetical protein
VRERRAALGRAHKRLAARDGVVRRHDEEHRVVGRDGMDRREREGRRGAASGGLEHDRLGPRADSGGLLGHEKAVRFVADHERLHRAVQRGRARQRLLQQRARAVQRVQRLRMMLSRERP